MSGVAVVQGQFRQGDNLQPVLKDQSGNVKTQHIRGDYIELGDDATLGAFAQSAAFLPPRGFQSAAAATNIGFKGETTAVAAFLPRPGYIYFTTTAAADNWTFTTPALMDAAYPHMAVHDSFIFELGVTGTGSAVLVANGAFTISGTATVATLTCVRFSVQKTAASTYVCTRIACNYGPAGCII